MKIRVLYLILIIISSAAHSKTTLEIKNTQYKVVVEGEFDSIQKITEDGETAFYSNFYIFDILSIKGSFPKENILPGYFLIEKYKNNIEIPFWNTSNGKKPNIKILKTSKNSSDKFFTKFFKKYHTKEAFLLTENYRKDV